LEEEVLTETGNKIGTGSVGVLQVAAAAAASFFFSFLTVLGCVI